MLLHNLPRQFLQLPGLWRHLQSLTKSDCKKSTIGRQSTLPNHEVKMLASHTGAVCPARAKALPLNKKLNLQETKPAVLGSRFPLSSTFPFVVGLFTPVTSHSSYFPFLLALMEGAKIHAMV
jgi:hypothetical protein